MNKRIFYSANSVLSDKSVVLNNYNSGTATISVVASQDALYIGSYYPFNHLYIKMGTTVNAETASIALKYWDGQYWKSVVDQVDETSVGGVTLAQSGFITFVPDKLYRWNADDTNDSIGSNHTITDLDSVVVYDKFWLKITFSANLTADIDLSWVGQKFSDDENLFSEYPEFNNSSLLAGIETGKTDWEEQHIAAGEIIVDDLVERGVIASGENILIKEDLKRMSISKVAQLIYNMRGEEYFDDADRAKKEYEARMKKKFVRSDKDQDGRLDKQENKFNVGNLNR